MIIEVSNECAESKIYIWKQFFAMYIWFVADNDDDDVIFIYKTLCLSTI